jgi:spectinomycin phosphotransferase
LTLPQWTERGAFLARLHASALPDEIARTVPRETFVPERRCSAVVRGLLSGANDDREEPIARELAALVRERHEEIAQVLRRAEELGRLLQARHGEFVLCHADSHPGNMMIDPTGGLHIVDWDQPIYAPRERDLMFALTTALAGCAAGSPEEAAFFAGYGPARPDPVALAYYRYEWAVQDIGEFASSIVVRTHTGEEEKRDSLRMLKIQFEPGQIVDAAYRSEEALREGR